MSNNSAQLTPELLDRFRVALAKAGAPLADAIEPGLTDKQVDRLARKLGLEAPPELRALWKWGVATSKPEGRHTWNLNPEFDLWPPARAVRETKTYRSEGAISRSMIAFGGPGSKGALFVTGDAAATHSTASYVFVDDPGSFQAAPSLGALFELWSTQMEDRAYAYANDRWHDPDEPLLFIPPDGN